MADNMKAKFLSDAFAVAARLTPCDMEWVHAQGFRTLICNRPDAEASDQPVFQAIEDTARAVGLTAHYLPIAGGGRPSENDIARFQTLLQTAEKPVLAYCRSGTRSAMLFTLSRQVTDPTANQENG